MLRKFIYSLLLGSIAFGASAIIASPDPIEIVQPDGSSLTIILSGDEYHHIARTLDGKMVKADPEGFYRYVDIDSEGHLSPIGDIARNIDLRSEYSLTQKPVRQSREPDQKVLLEKADEERLAAIERRKPLRMTANQIKNMPAAKRAEGLTPGIGLCDKAFPAYGDQKAIVILVEYQDVQFSIQNAHELYTNMLNEEGFYLFDATGSARDFFIENSKGQFRPQFDVYGPVTLSGDRKTYGANNSWGDDSYPEGMVIEACQQLDSTVDFSEYDRDGDGYIDNIFVFYAGGGEHDGGGGADAVWPHAANITHWISTPYVYDGVRLDSYGCTCERQRAYNRPDGIGTFVHEFSHVMGLPDLYTTAYNESLTPKGYSALDSGSYNNKGLTPPNYSSFERTALGWMKATEFGEDGWYILPELSESNFAYIIPSDDPSEFLLLENRQRQGNDRFLPGHGLLVWRIDYDHDIWEANSVNNTPSHQRVDIIEADGLNGEGLYSHYPFPGGGRVTSFGYNTVPALDFRNGTKTMIELTSIEEVLGKIGFSYTTDGSGGASVKEISNSDSDIYDLAGQQLTAKEPLTIYTVSGTRLASLQPGDSYRLPAHGLYLVTTPTLSDKIRI